MRATEHDIRVSTAETTNSERISRGASPVQKRVEAKPSPDDFTIALAWARPLEGHEELPCTVPSKGRASEGLTTCSGANSVLLTEADVSQQLSTPRVRHPRPGTSPLSSSRGLVPLSRRPITTVLSLESTSLSLVSGGLITHPTSSMELQQETFAFGGVFDERIPAHCCSDGPLGSLATGGMASDPNLRLHEAGTDALFPVGAAGYCDYEHPPTPSELTLE